MDHLSWQWRPHIAGCKLPLTLRIWGQSWPFCLNFFCKMYQWYMWGSQSPKNGVFFFLSILTPLKQPSKLTLCCLPKIWINPCIWQAPPNVLITGWEDLALNAGTLPNIVINPYFWQMPSNVLTTGLEEEEALNACDPYFWQAIHIFGKAPRVTKNGLQGPQKWFFHPDLFFSRIHTLNSCFFLQKSTLIKSLWSSLAFRALCIKHCQRHNGPEGWVHITSSNTNLDQISSSESWPSIDFKISTKHQPLHKT